MKKLILGILILASSAVSGQDSTKLTVKQVYNDVKAGFDKLVTNLQGPAKYTYESYVSQYKIHGWATFIGYMVPLLTLLILVLISFRKGKWKNYEPENKWAVGQIVSLILFCGLTLAFILSIGTVFTEMFNPQYHAIQEIIKTLK